ncbi:phosphoglycerate dehydrogenase [Falsihalocynthiibacter sp. CO-5D18]|uniref:phosphoglycerate dehydrogenase n=1 Tax=Falsihalocynthiibacter sp. CO-5D18 TaxID=3240872 RepID=UPI00350FD7D1
MDRILITPRSLTSSPSSDLDALRTAGYELVFATAGQTPNEAELLALIPDCVGWLAGVEPVSDAVIAAANKLRVISRNGTGVDNIPQLATAARNITITRAMAANATGVAELALGLILANRRHLIETALGVRQGEWPRLRGLEIEGSSVGVVGMGAIGRKVATAMSAMGATVIAYDPMTPDMGDLPITYLTLDHLLTTSDIITLHCPMPQDGLPLINAKVLTTTKQGLLLVNTARANLVDQAALLGALNDGRLSGYATDVFAQEPPLDQTLARHPAVIATSHIGGLTDQSVARATQIAVANLLEGLKGPAHA